MKKGGGRVFQGAWGEGEWSGTQKKEIFPRVMRGGEGTGGKAKELAFGKLQSQKRKKRNKGKRDRVLKKKKQGRLSGGKGAEGSKKSFSRNQE